MARSRRESLVLTFVYYVCYTWHHEKDSDNRQQSSPTRGSKASSLWLDARRRRCQDSALYRFRARQSVSSVTARHSRPDAAGVVQRGRRHGIRQSPKAGFRKRRRVVRRLSRMRAINRTSLFKRCFKLLERRHWDLGKLATVITKLANDAPATELFKDHPLSGRFSGMRECHVTSITDDWVLVYHKTNTNRLYLHATGMHSDIFG